MQNVEQVWELVENKKKEFIKFSDRVFDTPEILYQEFKSVLEHTNMLKKEGFKVTKNLCNMPTAVMGEYGEASLKLGNENTWMEMLEQIIRLRQASIDSDLAIKSFCAKFNTDAWSFSKKRSTKITCFINKIKKVDSYSLVFCHFRQEMELIKKELGKEGIESELYHGSMSLQERKEVIDKFPYGEEKKKALIIQIKAGGVGLNLQQFTNIFIISPDWNPCNEIQAIARAHRIGQHKKVVVHKFTIIANKKFMDDNADIQTIDQLIIQKQKLKRDLMVKTLNDKSLEFNETTV